MLDYRPNRVPRGTFCFTVNLAGRRSDLSVVRIDAFGNAISAGAHPRPPRDLPARSVPFFFVDDVERRLTRGKAPAVFEEDRFPFLAIGGCRGSRQAA
jgi:hypothetical protein